MPTLTTRQQRAAASKRRTVKVIFAVIGSLILHLLIVLAVLWIVPHWPKPRYLGKPISGPLRVEILPSATPTPAPSGPERAPYMRTTDDQKSDTKPKDPNFESDKDTLAASENLATGTAPLPTQEGHQSNDEFNFDPSKYRPGKIAQDATSNAPAPQPQAPTQEQKAEAPAPTATPLPTKSRPHRKDATPTTPVPNGELAMVKAEPAESPEPPAPTPEKPEDENGNIPPKPTRQQSRTQPAVQTNPSLVPNPGTVRPPGYQPETRPTKMVGNINNRGKSAVMAMGTPLGRYQKSVDDAISMLWYFRTEEQLSTLGAGDVKFDFHVNHDGKISGLRVVSGNSNSALASVSTGALMEADIPPMPPEVAKLLNGEMEMEYTFGIY